MDADRAEKLRGKQVLVVEDEYLIALALTDELERCGAVVIGPVGSVSAALRLIETCQPDVAVLDIQLHTEACYPAADVLIARETPLLFTTGHDADLVPPLYQAIPCVQKPAEAGAVVEALARLF